MLVLCAVLLAFLWFDPFGPQRLAWWHVNHGRVVAWRLGHPVMAGLAYVGASAIAIGLLLPVAAAMMVLAGIVFGLGWGVPLASFGFAIGSLLAFLLARGVLRDAVRAHLGSRLEPIERNLRADGTWYLLTLRLVPVVPAFLINVAMGLSPIRAWPFYWASQLGALPSVLVYVNAGAQLSRVQQLEDVMTPGVLLSLSGLAALPWLTRMLVRWLPRRRAVARTR